jgi:hypothetical protein
MSAAGLTNARKEIQNNNIDKNLAARCMHLRKLIFTIWINAIL